MTQELRPIPIIKGTIARRFYRNINTSKITEQQNSFLDECIALLDSRK